MFFSWIAFTFGMILLCIPHTLSVCRIDQSIGDLHEYTCDSIYDLQINGSANMLDLSIYNDTRLSALGYDMFQNTPNLEILQIRRSIRRINEDAFKFLSVIKKIIIDFNSELKELVEGTFRDIPVQYIDLSYNAIIEIQPGAFSKVGNLKHLQITNNYLGKIKKGVFSDLPIEKLSLSRNFIRTIEDNAFDNLKNLKRLQLDGNRLTEFHSENLINFGTSLEILWLHNNSFEEINRNTVKGLTNLRIFNLQDNKISRISPYTFESLINLETLILSNNSLEIIDPNVFRENGMPKLESIIIDHNRLSFLKTNLLGKLLNLKNIRLGGNPWKCSCLDLILLWIDDHKIKIICDNNYFQGTRPVCISPSTNGCTYIVDHYNIRLYLEANSKLPPERKNCFL